MTKSSPSAAKERITIGRVGAPHGVAGAVRIVPLTDFPERFADMKEVMVGDELLHIGRVQYYKKHVLMTFDEYPQREQAMCLTGKLLTISRAEAAPLAPGEYYTFDIIGLAAKDMAGNVLGQITDVRKTGSNDIYVMRDAAKKETLIPALKKVVKEINVADGYLLVDLPEDLA